MREIKFRAWDKDMKSMSSSYPFIEWQRGLVNGLNEEGLKNVPDGYLEKLVFMQYTGLKDKNGVEIYEGDIIKNYQADINEVFQDDDGSWCMRNHHASSLPLIDYAENSEIIGNIYENPELLNGNKE